MKQNPNLSYREIFRENIHKLFSIKVIKIDLCVTMLLAIIILLFGLLLKFLELFSIERDFDILISETMLWSMLPLVYFFTLTYAAMKSFLGYLGWGNLEDGEKFSRIAMTLGLVYLIVNFLMFITLTEVLIDSERLSDMYQYYFYYYWVFLWFINKDNRVY